MVEFIVPRSRVRAVLTPRAEAANRANWGDVEGTRAVVDGFVGRLMMRRATRQALIEKAELHTPQTTA